VKLLMLGYRGEQGPYAVGEAARGLAGRWLAGA